MFLNLKSPIPNPQSLFLYLSRREPAEGGDLETAAEDLVLRGDRVGGEIGGIGRVQVIAGALDGGLADCGGKDIVVFVAGGTGGEAGGEAALTRSIWSRVIALSASSGAESR